LYRLGALDFAGGTVVHICSGASALVFSIFMKQRKGSKSLFTWVKDKIFKPKKDIIVNWKESNKVVTHSVPNVLLGTSLLWFGWFGFNGGSAIRSTNLASIAFLNTMLSACSGGLTWMIVVWIIEGRPKIVATCEGIVAGLVAITPGCAFMNPGFAILTGIINSIISPLFIYVKSYVIDDTLDAVGVHLTGGIVGTFLTGIFASKDMYLRGTGATIGGGWIDGNWVQLPIQLAAIASAFVWSFGVTFILFWIFYIFGWNVNDYEERIGLDASQHSEQCFIYEPPEPTGLLDGERKVFRAREFIPALIKKPKDIPLKEFIVEYGKPQITKKEDDDE
jgi:ammonium transporter, Amt family